MDKDILTAIDAASDKFSKGQRNIAKYIAENYEKAAFMTAGKLGQVVSVSESTVVRFAQELGYGSYPEMRRALQDMIRSRMTSVQRIRVSQDLLSGGDMISHVLSSDIEQIRLTMEETNRDDFERAVNAIVGAKSIYIFGLRSSSALANFMGFYFNLLFENVHVVNESSSCEVFEQIVRISKDDVFIALSFPRYSRRTVRAMRYARDMGATLIGITDNNVSPIAKLADVSLYAKSDMVSFLDTLVAPLSLVNALIVATSARSGGDLYSNFERLERIWDEYEVYEKIDV
ncbi:MAG: MurR/RpiR family transcriptional regulator [Oscillospiraceae bacterium]|jgi:DNA-binding MurR/RpiR family transcriptional regulator|nr:MurR/RpiR family transcriptional regulator [Oscillospiraceae bacterium]